jgi:hypothetical protein
VSEPLQIPLVAPLGNRYNSLTVDSRLVNCFAEQGSGKDDWFVYKRPGLTVYDTHHGATGTARGMYQWRGSLYTILNGTMYRNGIALVGALNNGGTYSFSPSMGATPRLFFKNTANAYVVDGAGTITAVTGADPDYPASTVYGSAYLDGTTYVMDGEAKIYGSAAALDDPTSWDALNLITAQIEPTAGVALAKQLSYVVALKREYTELFYDSGNATGSPLSRVPGAKVNYGCFSANTLKSMGGDLVWVADTGEGTVCVVLMTNAKIDVISTPQIERILSAALGAESYFCWGIRFEGHRFYGLTLVNANITLVYDLTVGVWYQWTDSSGNYFPAAFSAYETIRNQPLFLHPTNGNIYTLDSAAYQDDGATFPVEIYTPNWDGQTRRTKTLARVDFLGDAVATDVTLAFSDDDYATWSSTYTTTMNLARPGVADLGEFYRRAFKIRHFDNTAFRIKSLEAYLGVGVS